MTDRRPVALVTGSTRGIGLGIARHLSDEGCDIILSGTRPQSGAGAAIDALSGGAGDVHYLSADIGDFAAAERLGAEAVAWRGGVDILVNNAGVAPNARVDLLESDGSEFDRLMAINVRGPHALTRIVANHMVTQPRPGQTIVNITSVSAAFVSPERSEYCMSKAAQSMMSQAWAVRLAEHDINVFEIRPGIIETDMTAKVKEKYDAFIAEGSLLQPRWGTPDDIGRAVAMLVRGDLPYATGQVLTMDGGFSVRRL